MHIEQADLLALGEQVVDGFLGGLGGGTHEDDHALGVRRAVVVEQLILATGQLADLCHVALDCLGNGIDLLVAGLAALKENVGVDGRAARRGMLGVKRVLAERLERVHVNQRAQRLIIKRFDLLNLVARAEAVEEVQEGHTAMDGGKVRHRAEVHNLLRGRGSEHRKAGAAHAHHVAVIAEDGERVRGERARGNVKYARQHLACDLIHIGDHQQKSLRSGVSGGQRAGLQRAVHRAGGAALGLHLDDLHRFAKQIFFAVCCPGIHMLRHRGRRSDGENAGDLSERIRDISRSLVAVHDCYVFCH